MDDLQHECGVAALYQLPGAKVSPLVPDGDARNVTRLMPRMLIDLQNRGQLAAGLTSYDADRDVILETYKEIGTVIEAFRLNREEKAKRIMQEHSGTACIGHVRYATCGENSRSYAQPFERRHGCKWKWFSFGFNGQLANFRQLRHDLLSLSDYHLTRDNDTEVIMHYIAHEHRNDHRPDLVEVFRHLSEKFDGAYNLVYLNAMGDMVVLRDPKGIRPLCFAQDGGLFGAASESVPLANLGFKDIEFLEPGEMIVIRDGKIQRERFAPRQRSAHCFFEWVYFANVASSLDDRSVYLTRSALGRELAMMEFQNGRVPIDQDTIVVPVPDTAKAAADAMAHALGVPSVEGLIRNRAIGRTFIEGNNRGDKAKLKYTPLREVLQGKRVLLVEDSIVRSTTLHSLLHHLRDRGGAKEIHVRVACPPIIAPCFYGIDMSTVKELFAPRYMKGRRPTLEEQDRMAKDLGADSLMYLPLEAVSRCIGIGEERLCRACITGDYPTPAGEQLFQLALKTHSATGDESRGGDGRTYEVCPPDAVNGHLQTADANGELVARERVTS
ncbi:MAG TPA: amidophosphoribosyltransferase [Gemmataceae bacterium]|nr:amidophosphoribosyltransferase [Gemmataceae bacterium]